MEEMKTRFGCVCLLAALALAACGGWPGPVISYQPATVLPSHTPLIRTPTPIIVSPAPSTLPTVLITLTPASATPTPTTTPAETLTPTPTDTPTAATSSALPVPSLTATILGCDTSVDILHGMGEVTDAYVTVADVGQADATDVCATLSGLDEGRPHPDKTKCLASLPNGFQVTWKLTVDTTYEKNTPIQVDVTSNQVLVTRVGQASCVEIGLLLPSIGDLGVIKPIP